MTRIMLKISGEVMGGPEGSGADGATIAALCKEIAAVHGSGVELAIVVGGGNFWRFRDNKDIQIPRESSDAIGMMATIMNARLLQEALRSHGVPAQAMAMHADFYFAEPYVPNRGKSLLSKGKVVICGGGTGNPYFTTDTTAALRALELDCEVLMKATNVDGVYDSDPSKNPDAELFTEITYNEVLKRELGVMDLNAIVLAKENKLPVRVFNLQKEGNLAAAARGEAVGTLVSAA